LRACPRNYWVFGATLRGQKERKHYEKWEEL
jgi:hypothetical protein